MRFIASMDQAPPTQSVRVGQPLVFHDGGIRIWGDQPVRSVGSGILIVGSYHERHEPDGEVSDCPFRALLEQGWGDYVAIRPSRNGADLDILVSPSSAIPCYVSRIGSRLVLGSDAESVLRAAGQAIHIDWQAVVFQLCHRQARGLRTALKELTEIPAGCAGSVRRGELTIMSAWRPAHFARLTPDSAVEQCAGRLRQAVQTVVSTAGREWHRALIGISGGIDSSIVAATCLTAGIEFDCFTMFEADSDGDERSYARLLASRLGKALVECPYSVDDVNIHRSSVAHLPRPIGWQFQQSLDTACDAVARALGADIVLRGTGGDAIFYASHTAAPIVDALRGSGPIAGARTLLDVCRLHGCSVWTAARLALRKLVRPDRGPACADTDLLLAREQQVPPAAHPWDVDSTGLLPGRREHVRMIASIENFVEARLALATEASCPLFSQPVIEAALTIPSRFWVDGGVNRAVARMAFSDLLPKEILRRRSKGTADSFAARLLKTKRAAIRELLLDGLLVKNGIVDPVALEDAFRWDSGAVQPSVRRVMALVDAETWTQHWSSLA